MRPLRFLLLLFFFVALPIALTCWSLITAVDSAADSFHAGYNTRSSRLRALFSFSTPSSLFPPSAVISLTYDNSTFFLARPAAFGPTLPSKGLTGELWVGKGFGDDALLKEQNIHIVGWELGCSDVPGWGELDQKHARHPPPEQATKSVKLPRGISLDNRNHDISSDHPDQSATTEPSDDGTDDHLHRPLEDSNPATPAKPGEPANVDQADRNKKSIHADIESLQESADIAGKVVMLARGGCGFLEKVKWAQRRGGIALIVGDNEKGGQLTIMYAKGDTSNVTIPALFTSYTSAHLLASLVPPEERNGKVGLVVGDKPSQSPKPDKTEIQKQQDNGPVFTTTQSGAKRPASTPAEPDEANGWIDGFLSALGANDDSPFSHQEDSRRPPSSGNIDWILLEDWDDDKPAKTAAKSQTTTAANGLSIASSPKSKPVKSQKSGGDDFVIGVQDWRDTDLIAPKSHPEDKDLATATKSGKAAKAEAMDPAKSTNSPESALKGGSITPGSGEYHHDKGDQTERLPDSKHVSSNRNRNKAGQDDKQSSGSSWLDIFRANELENAQNTALGQNAKDQANRSKKSSSTSGDDQKEHEGLWVTLTPTSVSTSPFFDTLLVLVVSPLITLTVVYALLLLRSRIRRRRWRAPKSVVERLPVRTYHTMTTTSSTTSSQVPSTASSPTSPLLISTTQDLSRRPTSLTRTRSQTYAGIFPSSSVDNRPSNSTPRSSPNEKNNKNNKRKRYTGRQIECVVCLEEYVDGESQVMSLPCGHEFHAECITPWLVTRRRTCPICKGDVVRSMARDNAASRSDDEIDSAEDEQTSDDIQNRVAQTINNEPSAAIPIPVRNDEDLADNDVERGVEQVRDPLLGNAANQPEQSNGQSRSIWGRIASSSMRGLSGDTLWRQTPVDRNR